MVNRDCRRGKSKILAEEPVLLSPRDFYVPTTQQQQNHQQRQQPQQQGPSDPRLGGRSPDWFYLDEIEVITDVDEE